MKRDLEEKIHIAEALIGILKEDAAGLKAKSEEIPDTLKRAYMARFKIYSYYLYHNKPSSLLKQIKKLDTVIKRIEKKHTKYVADLR